MASTLAHDEYRSLSRQPPSDPDIQATLSDFLTYTEHFPSHLTRALTLIHEQRVRAEEKILSIHNDTTTYSILPSLTHDRPDLVELRRRISYALEDAETACRMAVVEAERLDFECKKEARKLDIVAKKLRAQPTPPSRDPTPEQNQLTSPNLKRESRLSGRGDDARVEKASRRQDKAASKLRGRKVMVPGEVLPPPDPSAMLESVSDWTSPRASPPILDEPPVIEHKEREKKHRGTPRARSRTPKQQKSRGPRLPGQPGTNAHSAVAGISTSNALLALTRPPDDAVKGSKWLPWIKLTEWEMANLRKRMKKNAIWVPSQTMVRRELKNLGRGIAGKEAAKAHADATGEPFVDEHNEPDPTGPGGGINEDGTVAGVSTGAVAYEDDDDADAELVNRGMRLNEAKKLKRQRMQEELQEQIAREQGDEAAPEVTKRVSISPEAQKKRKRDSSPVLAPANLGDLSTEPTEVKGGPAAKRIKTFSAPSTLSTSTKVPLAPAGVSSPPNSKPSRRRAATPPPANKPTTLNLKVSNKAVSEEPPNRRANLRRASNASMPEPAPEPAQPKRRSKRPAPGFVTSNADDGQSAKVGVSRRKAAPKRNRVPKDKKDPTASAAEEDEEEIKPNEPTYCLCGDVSWGMMIACDNEDCEKEWFHLECVGLTELPPRRGKWFCPDCTKKGHGVSVPLRVAGGRR